MISRPIIIIAPLMLAVTFLAACGRDSAPAVAATAQGDASPPQGAAAPTVPGVETVSGTVLESINSGGYTYVRLQTAKDAVWFAATDMPVKTGERLTVPLEMPMQNFHSKTLNRDFPIIYFVSQVAREGQALTTPEEQRGAQDLMGSHASASTSPAPVERIAVPQGGLSIADVWTKRASLAGKPVTVRGKVVKANSGIMDRNWFHVQDGSGSAADGTNDLTVTTVASVAVGDVVTVSGVLALGKDFGAGYAYEAIIENATVTLK